MNSKVSYNPLREVLGGLSCCEKGGYKVFGVGMEELVLRGGKQKRHGGETGDGYRLGQPLFSKSPALEWIGEGLLGRVLVPGRLLPGKTGTALGSGQAIAVYGLEAYVTCHCSMPQVLIAAGSGPGGNWEWI